MAFPNPFARDTEGRTRNITAYKVTTLLSFLLQFVTTLYYQFNVAKDGHWHHTIPGESWAHITPFTVSHVFMDIYWVVLWISQIVFVWHLFSRKDELIKASAAVGSHFILFNLLHFAWVMLWVRNHTIWSELILIINFFNVLSVYLRYSTAPRLIHLSVSVLPLVYIYFMILWNGAVAVHCHGLVCRIFANVAIWGIAVFAGFFLVAFKDYYVGFATAFLAAGLGVGQFFTKVIALQWPFAFAVMAVVFLSTLVVAVPGIFGTTTGHEASGRSGERAPLLREDA